MSATAVARSTGSRRADSKGRVALGAEAVGKEFTVETNEQGQFILTPMARVPEREAWLYRNPAALALFREGLAAAAAGEITEFKDYSEYADSDVEE